jgi:SSS family solute:Na+ symporter
MALMLTFALSLVIAVNFSVPVNQFMLQVAMSASSERDVVKAMWLAVPLNGLFCVFIVVLGMTAKTMPEFGELGPKLAAPAMLAAMLPGWLAMLLLGTFVAAVLSTFAMTCLAPATIFSMDLYRRLFRPDATGAEITRVTRIAIVTLAAAATAMAGFLPPILAALSWLLAWLIPILWLVFTGLFWRCSTGAAVATLAFAWTVNMLWTFTPLAGAMGMQQVPNVYVALVVTVATGTLANLVAGTAKAGYFKSQAYAARVAAK